MIRLLNVTTDSKVVSDICTEEVAVEGIEYTTEYEVTEDWQQATKLLLL